MSVKAFSYSGDPSSSDKDKVRFLLGDTDSSKPLLGDKEILYLISSEAPLLKAAMTGALAIAASFSRLSDESVGDVSKSYSQLSDKYHMLADKLRRKNAEKSVCPYAGGISDVDKQILENDDDSVQPSFTRELHNNPRSSDLPNFDDESNNT